MPTTAFDTLTAASQLEDAGIEARQAKAIVTVIRQSGEAVATRADMTEVRATFSRLCGLRASVCQAPSLP